MSLRKWITRSTNSIGEIAGIYAVLLFFCSGIYAIAENKSFFDSVWWAIVTSTSTGYGDMYPVTLAGRLVGGFLMISAIFIVAPMIIVNILNGVVENKNEFNHEEQEQLKQRVAEIDAKINQLLEKQ